jgi:outer membrane autotransporter protein
MTYNQRSVAFNLDTAVADPREAALFNFLHNVPNSQLSATYDLIAPEELTSIFQLGFSGAEVQGYNLYNRIRDIRAGSSGFSASGLSLFDPVGAMDGMPRFASNQPVEQQAAMSKGAMEASPENKWGVFVSGAGELAGVRADANASGYHLTSGGLTVGADYRCNENFAVGVALGYNNTEADLTGDGEVDVNGGRGDLYGVWFKDGWHVEGMAGGGFNTYDTKREGLLGDAKGDTQGAEATGLLGFGYDWQSGPWTFGPQAKAQYTWVDIDSFREDGSMAPLRINSQDANSLYSQVGAHLMYRIQCGKVVLVPEIEVGWRHEYMDSTISLDSRFNSGAGTVFDVRGPELGRDSLVAGAGVTIRWNDRVSTSLNYNTQLLRSHYNLHSFSAGIRISL